VDFVLLTSTYSLERREKAKVEGGDVILRVEPISLHGLGKLGMLNTELLLNRFGLQGKEALFGLSQGPRASESSTSCRVCSTDNVEEFTVTETLRVVGFSFTPGAKTEEVGSFGNDLLFENPRPTPVDERF
jgi:hypothetical protein